MKKAIRESSTGLLTFCLGEVHGSISLYLLAIRLSVTYIHINAVGYPDDKIVSIAALCANTPPDNERLKLNVRFCMFL